MRKHHSSAISIESVEEIEMPLNYHIQFVNGYIFLFIKNK